MTLQDTGRDRNFPNKVTLAHEIATTIDNQDFIQFIVFCIAMATIREENSLKKSVKTKHEKGGYYLGCRQRTAKIKSSQIRLSSQKYVQQNEQMFLQRRNSSG